MNGNNIVLLNCVQSVARRNAPREKIWPAITLGIVALMLSTLAMQLVFYADVSAYESCIESAQTQQARGACEQLREQSPIGSRLLFE